MCTIYTLDMFINDLLLVGHLCTCDRTAEYVLRLFFTMTLDAHVLFDKLNKTITNTPGATSGTVSPIADLGFK